MVVTFSSDLHTVESDVLNIMDAATETGLQLNQAKCEIIIDDFELISASPTFRQFILLKKQDKMVLDAPVIKIQDTSSKQTVVETCQSCCTSSQWQMQWNSVAG